MRMCENSQGGEGVVASKTQVKQFQRMKQSPSRWIEFFPITPVGSGLNSRMRRMRCLRRLFNKQGHLQGARARNG